MVLQRPVMKSKSTRSLSGMHHVSIQCKKLLLPVPLWQWPSLALCTSWILIWGILGKRSQCRSTYLSGANPLGLQLSPPTSNMWNFSFQGDYLLHPPCSFVEEELLIPAPKKEQHYHFATCSFGYLEMQLCPSQAPLPQPPTIIHAPFKGATSGDKFFGQVNLR